MKKLLIYIFIATIAPLSYAQNGFNTEECSRFYNQKIEAQRSQRYSASESNRVRQRLRQLNDEKRGCANGTGILLYDKFLAKSTQQRRQKQPAVITSCDATGCWDNLGNRYNNGGGNVMHGPKGACINTGTQFICP